MRWTVFIVFAAISTSACLAYKNPTAPEVKAVSTTDPFSLTIGSLGTSTGNQSVVNARVQNVNGAPLAGIPVMFSTDAGSLSNDSGITSGIGTVSTTWTGNGSANVNAWTGTLNAHTIVISNAPVPATPTPQIAFLNVSGSATTGVPVAFSVSSAATGMTWLWSFGDGATEQGTAFSISHTYGRPGLYTANVSSSKTVATSATINVTDPPTPAPAPVASLSLTLTCPTPTTHTLACNVSATFGGNAVPSGSLNVGWDWGDGAVTPSSQSPVATHPYGQAGTYPVVATVTYAGSAAVTSKSVAVPFP